MDVSTYKDVTVGGRRFRIARATAFVGSWLLQRMMAQMMAEAEAATARDPQALTPSEDDAPPPVPDPEVISAVMAQNMLKSLSRPDFEEVQRLCLDLCSRYEQTGDTETPMPVLMAGGQFALRDLESDMLTVFALTNQALAYVLGPFFAAGSLQLKS